jgi:hypothetical protein
LEWHEYLKRIIEEPNVALQLWAGLDQEAHVAAMNWMQVLMDQDSIFSNFEEAFR